MRKREERGGETGVGRLCGRLLVRHCVGGSIHGPLNLDSRGL